MPGDLFDANLKWHMLISEEICCAEQKYMEFLGPSPSGISVKNYNKETYTNDSILRSGFLFHKTRSVTVPRFGFIFQDSRIWVKCQMGFTVPLEAAI